jgi:hypothetical protein
MRYIVTLILLLATPALAQQRPLVQPSRDVAVSYQVRGVAVPGMPPGPQRMEVAYSAVEQRLLLASPGYPQGYAVVALAARSILLVLPAARAYIPMPMRGPEMALLSGDPGLSFTASGSDRVAGLRCTVWRIVETGAGGRPDRQTGSRRGGSACITADGVLLRGDDGRGGRSVVATSVRYGHQPAARFAVPQGFHRIEMPRLPGR